MYAYRRGQIHGIKRPHCLLDVQKGNFNYRARREIEGKSARRTIWLAGKVESTMGTNAIQTGANTSTIPNELLALLIR